MRRKRLFWQLFPTYLLVALVPLLIMAWYATRSLDAFYHDHLREDLQDRAALVAELLAARGQAGAPEVDALCKRIGKDIGSRITIITPRGFVLGDSDEDPAKMEDHSNRPEIITAMQGRTGDSQRYSDTLRGEMVYVAIPLRRQGKVALVVRTAMPMTEIDRTLRALTVHIVGACLALALLVAALGWWVSRRISRPLETMKEAAERFATGDLTHELSVPDSAELAALAEAMNAMAAQLDARIRTIIEDHAQLEAILGSMVEGVLALDTEEHVLSINQTAADLLHVDFEKVRGRSLFEIIRNPDLQHFTAKLLEGRAAMAEFTLYGEGDVLIEAHGAVLHDRDNRELGAVIVMHDITRLRRLEEVRRDFVANVSHELKTPVTAIKGFVETLLGGATDSPEDTERFLNIISRQADRLNAIIEDLLTLSRLEREAERAEITLATGPIRGVLHSAVEVCATKAAARSIEVTVHCPGELQARINPALLEQAVVNLVDNAVNYSPPGSRVGVEARQGVDGIVISVEDHGCGIPQDEQTRIFERFYRVDKARSRAVGGTGLGLAIVKHILQVHRGGVTVESALGKGSTFRLHLPANPTD